MKIGSSVRYSLREMEKWLEERTQRSTSETVPPVSGRGKIQRAPAAPRHTTVS